MHECCVKYYLWFSEMSHYSLRASSKLESCNATLNSEHLINVQIILLPDMFWWSKTTWTKIPPSGLYITLKSYISYVIQRDAVPLIPKVSSPVEICQVTSSSHSVLPLSHGCVSGREHTGLLSLCTSLNFLSVFPTVESLRITCPFRKAERPPFIAA